ncbi:MAG: HAMP domain-containing histidine kinase [Oscillospiraceae bacterium]|nr:HAMP domain-containing histidine kinase [Oscillospiraceae bacterium]
MPQAAPPVIDDDYDDYDSDDDDAFDGDDCDDDDDEAFRPAQFSDGRMDGHKELSAETPYESRYFSVLLDAEGAEQSVDTGRIAAVDSLTAVRYAESVYESGRTRGFLDTYRYTVVSEDGGTRVIFLDCGRSLETFRSFLLASAGVSLLGLISVGSLIVAFSGRIVRPVAESYEKQKRFITDAGHEIKTPLAIINADAEVLEMDLGEDNEWLRDIQKQTQRLAGLTNDLVYLSRMEEQQSAVVQVDFPISDVVAEQAQSFRALAKTQGKTFTEAITPMLTLCGDEKAVRQLTSILLDNAVKYSPEGGEIRLTLEKQGRNLALSVYNDASVPVPRAELGKLFDRFYRTDPSRSSETGGHGIGLSIARAIVTAHKGKITASTEDEKSLAITAIFPTNAK